MTRFGNSLLLAICLSASAGTAATNGAPDFSEVYGLVRTHLAGATDAELNRAAVEGLLSALRGRATLVDDSAPPPPTNAPLISRSAVLENDVAYVRVARVEEGLAQAFTAAVRALEGTNQLKGVVLDLRFGDGRDYAAAAAVADAFLTRAKPLLDWGNGVVQSKKKDTALGLPAAVLVNRQTSGAAEALAAVLRETGAGLLLGSTTAGRAMTAREFPLNNGQRLRIATALVKLGDGSALSTQGCPPDIEVAVTPEEEQAYFEDPYAFPPRNQLAAGPGPSATNQVDGTNRPVRRPRPTEADLVRARREGTALDADALRLREAEPERPLLRDPALARAVDLLKGLAVVGGTGVRASRSR